MKNKDLYISLILLLIARLIAMYVLPMFDDSYITLKYSLNLGLGKGFVFNEGEKLLGTTAPLWGLLNSIWFFLGLDGVTCLSFLNIFLDLLFYTFISKIFLFKNNKIAQQIFIILFCLTPIIARVAVGGMEVNLFALLSFLALYFFFERKYNYALILLSFIYFLRPEIVLLIGLLAAMHYKEHRNLSEILKLSLIPIAIVGTGILIMYAYYHTFIPQSVIAKSSYGRVSWGEILYMVFFKDPIVVIALISSFLSFKIIKENRVLTTLNIWSLIYLLSYLISRQKVFSWYPYVIILTVLINFAFFLSNFSQIKKLNDNFVYFSTVVVLLTSLSAYFILGQNIITKNIYNEIKKDEFLLGNKNDKLLAWDVGVIGFYSKSKIIDGDGLITKLPRRILDINETIRIYNPDLLFVIALDSSIIKLNKSTVYKPIKRYNKNGIKDFSSNLTKIEAGWVQDYILYKRVD